MEILSPVMRSDGATDGMLGWITTAPSIKKNDKHILGKAKQSKFDPSLIPLDVCC